MTVTVLLFESYADVIGRSSLELSLPPGSTVSAVVAELSALAAGERLPPRPLVAVNETYASLSTVLASGDEVAVIPPVAGG